jgi:hypothetical protein
MGANMGANMGVNVGMNVGVNLVICLHSCQWVSQNGSCKMAPAKSVLQIDFRKIGLADRLLQNRSCRSAPAKSVSQNGSCKMVPAKWFRPERGSPAGGVAVRIAGTMLKISKI